MTDLAVPPGPLPAAAGPAAPSLVCPHCEGEIVERERHVHGVGIVSLLGCINCLCVWITKPSFARGLHADGCKAAPGPRFADGQEGGRR